MENIKQNKYDLKIRIAGNTEVPCFAAIKTKGYKVTCTEYVDSEYFDWNAEKDNRLFSATSPIELLGLIAMWEVRGDNWQARGANHPDQLAYEEVYNNMLTYYHDEDGYPHLVEKK